MDQISVIAIGSEVRFKASIMEGIVTAINLRGNPAKLQYEVVYWQIERKSVWVEAFEIVQVSVNPNQLIGFISSEA